MFEMVKRLIKQYENVHKNDETEPAQTEARRYPISDARIMFDSEKQRDEFKALLEKEAEKNDTRPENIARIL